MDKCITYRPFVLASNTNEPHGPRLALSSISKSIIRLDFLENQFHFNCPRASAVGTKRAALPNPERTDMKEFNVNPVQFGTGLWL
jgi:hypothetical protein